MDSSSVPPPPESETMSEPRMLPAERRKPKMCVYLHVRVHMDVSLRVKQMGGKREIREGQKKGE